MSNDFIIKIYNDRIFKGYLKKYRLHKNGYRFSKTKNIKLAYRIMFEENGEILLNKMYNLDRIYYHNNSYIFKLFQITQNEIRKSKLYSLSLYKKRTTILKRKIDD